MVYLLFLSLTHGQSLFLGGTGSVCWPIPNETDESCRTSLPSHCSSHPRQEIKTNQLSVLIKHSTAKMLSHADSSFRKDVPGLVSSASPLGWLSACRSFCLSALCRTVLNCHNWPHIAIPSVWPESKQFRPIEKRTLDPFGHWSQLIINELKMEFLFSAHLEPDTSQMRSISDCGCNSCRSETSLD